uniref:dihydropyrimidinase n=1 Tax=Rhodnius prolixus TaxID=13249 RepID=A0A4P6D8S4_RHOPR
MFGWWRTHNIDDSEEDDATDEQIILIRNGTVVNSDSYALADVLIVNGKVSEIGKGLLAYEDTFVIDATDMLLMPGGIDPSTHFDFIQNGVRTAENFYSGTKAALAGGTTMIMDFAIPYENECLVEALKRTQLIANDSVVCDYSLHMVVRSFDEKTPNEISCVTNTKGVNSFKVFMGYAKDLIVPDDVMYNIFLACRKSGALPMVHAENQTLIDCNSQILLVKNIKGPEAHYLARPDLIEGEAVYRACTIANSVKAPLYVCNVMSEYAADVINGKLQTTKIPIYGEVTASALGSTGPPANSSESLQTAYIRSPPIRQDQTTSVNLMKRLSQGELTLTASDDCSYYIDDKLCYPEDFAEIPCGVNGVEDRMSVVWEKGVNTGMLSKCHFVAVTSTNAAKIFNMYPKKGIIDVGSDADIVIWDPQKFKQIVYQKHDQNCDYNIFHKMKIIGNPDIVLVKGAICYYKGVFKVRKGFGKFVKRNPYCEFVYKRINQ